MKRLFYLLSIFLLISCGNSKNSPDFIKATEGRYLFNSDEAIDITFTDGIMKVKWRDQEMTPIKANDSSFYLKEMNEKLVFVSKPKMHIELAPKREHEGKKFSFSKLEEGQKTPAEYFKNKEYDKALEGYLAIQKRDSLDRTIRERYLNSLGYNYLRENKLEEAKEVFKINIALYPKSSNTYDSMGDAYRREKDTVKALEYYRKAIAINPENRSSKRQIERLTKN
ncbi:tetratricopeptide repeat protein [Pseudotenacibaculum sp. MALMAid0570]|uniref:tetratricopeptide repeat protein n=1 Tax=Pseudotenacibaculum sp. MALMAid0570 TaxID=3143938 RepID=UPI0032DEC0C9